MRLDIRYYGMLQEITNTAFEQFTLEVPCTIADFRMLLANKYEKLQDTSYKIAVNQVLAADTQKIDNDAQLALLPPFAGG